MPLRSDSSSSPLRFFITEQKSILVVTYIGNLMKESLGVLEESFHQIIERDAKVVILNFRDVGSDVDRTLFALLTRMQKSIRDKSAILRLTSMHPELRKTLEERGIVRSEEQVENLAHALTSLRGDNAA